MHMNAMPFPVDREEASFELQDRGLRVITGCNNDDLASDSNGAGKSALVMAPLWAITGRTEPRSEAGFTACQPHHAFLNWPCSPIDMSNAYLRSEVER